MSNIIKNLHLGPGAPRKILIFSASIYYTAVGAGRGPPIAGELKVCVLLGGCDVAPAAASLVGEHSIGDDPAFAGHRGAAESAKTERADAIKEERPAVGDFFLAEFIVNANV